jgi:hypothetical protein
MTVKMKRNINKTEGHSKVIYFTIALALVLNLGLVMNPISSVGATTQTEEFTESGTFTVPETVTEITVQAWGGGGAGGGSTNTRRGARGGAGGGGGAYASSTLTVESGQELQVVVGVGGTGVSGNDGNAGNPSFVGPDTDPGNALVRAAAGSGGTGNTAGGSPPGGTGGTTEASIGDIRLAGADGENGDTGTGIQSGTGGDGANEGGSGGAAVTSGTSNGNPGNVPGGGGGGARTERNDGNQTGGAGAAGKVVITWVTFDLTISSTAGGSVTTPGEDTYTYDEGTVVDLIAEADACYEFVNWTGDVGTIADINAASTNITMNGNYSITANFEEIPSVQYELNTSSTAGGSIITPGEGVFTYDDGTAVALVAEAEKGYQFVEWTGDVGTIDDVYAATTTITMNGEFSITATFMVVYDLSASSTAGGSVSTPGEGVFTYGEASVVGLAAEAEEDYRFVEWTGDVGTIADVHTASTTITMNGDYSITANFKEISSFQYDLTIFSTEGGSVTEPGEELVTYDGGVVVDLVATPDEGYQFVDWTGDVDTIADIEAAVTTITINDNYSITANFVAAPSGGCFIATATYGTPSAEQIDVLREFRDSVLLESTAGSVFVSLYYQLSPPIADFIAGNEPLRILVRQFLIDPIVCFVEATGDVWRN